MVPICNSTYTPHHRGERGLYDQGSMPMDDDHTTPQRGGGEGCDDHTTPQKKEGITNRGRGGYTRVL